MTKIVITDRGFSFALMDVTVGKEYEVLRFLKPGDVTSDGMAVVPAGVEGVEFIDDAGDTVAHKLGSHGSEYKLIEDGETVETVDTEADTITFSDLGGDMVLRDVTVGKAYTINRHLRVGDFTFTGNEVNRAGIEFTDDVGDTVAFCLTSPYSTYTLSKDGQVVEQEQVQEEEVKNLGKIVITNKGFNLAFQDTTLNKPYQITKINKKGDVNSFGTPIFTEDDEGVEFIDDAGDVVSYIYGFARASHIISWGAEATA